MLPEVAPVHPSFTFSYTPTPPPSFYVIRIYVDPIKPIEPGPLSITLVPVREYSNQRVPTRPVYNSRVIPQVVRSVYPVVFMYRRGVRRQLRAPLLDKCLWNRKHTPPGSLQEVASPTSRLLFIIKVCHDCVCESTLHPGWVMWRRQGAGELRHA